MYVPNGKGEIGWIVIVHRFQSCFHALRHVGVGGEGDVLNRLRFARRALHRELSGFPVQILFAAFQKMGCDLSGFVADLARGHRRRRARDGCAAAGVGAKTVGRRIGVAFFYRHVGGRNAQFLGDDLSIGGLVSLSLALRAHAAHGLARRVNTNLGTIEHLDSGDVEGMCRARADDFDKARNTDAHQFAACCAFPAVLFAAHRSQWCRGRLSLRHRSCRCHRTSRVARLIGKSVRLDEVLSPQALRDRSLAPAPVHRPLVR